MSHLALPDPEGARTGPAGHVSIRKQTEYARFILSAMRSFVPAFGFGGSIENQEVIGQCSRAVLRVTGRTADGECRVAPDRRRCFRGEVGLKSIWLQTTRRVRLPAVAPARGRSTAARSRTRRFAGGRVDRNRIGVQVVTRTPHEAAIMATFHPLDYLSLVRRRKWWIVDARGRCASWPRRAGRLPAACLPLGGDDHCVVAGDLGRAAEAGRAALPGRTHPVRSRSSS